MSTIEQETLFEFPCIFPIKIMGLNSDDFKNEMVMIARKHIPDLAEAAVKAKPSKNGNYTSLTITFTAQSKIQLDSLYREVSAHAKVKMVL